MEHEPCMGSKDCTRDINEAWHLLVARGCLVFLRGPKPRLLNWEGLALLQGARCLRWWNYWASHVLAPTIPSVSLQGSLLWHLEKTHGPKSEASQLSWRWESLSCHQNAAV